MSKAYHKIILEELRRLNKARESDPPIYEITGNTSTLTKNEIIDVLRGDYGSYATDIFNELLGKRYLLELDDDSYRTLHMDVLVRSAEIRTYRWAPRYLLSSLVTYDLTSVPSDNDRVKLDGEYRTIDSLYNAVKKFFGNEKLSIDYINILREYASRGLDQYQIWALSEMLKSGDNVRVHVITGPTGIGKTYIFFLYILAKLMKMRAENISSSVVLVYPRKILAVDQTERLLRLLRIADERGYRFTVALRDGDTIRDWNRARRAGVTIFRGIRCPYCETGLLVYSMNGVKCENKKCGKELKLLIPYKEQMGQMLVDIMVTNLQTLEFRFMDGNPNDINIKSLLKVDTIVMDEVHEYIGITGGIMRKFLEKLEKLKAESGDIKIPVTYVLSSATIPSPKEFASKLTGYEDRYISVYDFHEFQKDRKKSSFSGERLALIAVFQMNPNFSWSTYCQLWAVLTSFIGYSINNIQSILFVNNVKELRRIHTGYEENISLGEPKDHIDTGSNRCPPTDAFCYSHYPEPSKLDSIVEELNSTRRLSKLVEYVVEVHSEIDPQERSKIIEKIRSGESLVLLSTSSLELGVDYPNVSFILSVGYEEPNILAQRIGRGGRSLEGSLRTVLGIILLRSIPHETMFLYDPKLGDRLRIFSKPKGSLPVTVDNPSIDERSRLIEAIGKLALNGERTYASDQGIKSPGELVGFLRKVMEALGG